MVTTHTHSIAIVTDQIDRDVSIVMQRLREMGHNVIRFHPAEFESTSLSIGIDQKSWRTSLSNSRNIVAIEELHSIWWRKPRPVKIDNKMGKDEKKIARIEMDAALSGLWALGDRCYWVSHPIALRTAENKPLQLVRAAQLGLEVPRTLISNRPNEIREFCARCQGRIVYKTMGQHILVENIPTEGESPGKDVSRTPLYRHFHTSLLTEESLNANIDTLSGIPLIFQEYVDKCYEYRVTIIGNDIFVAEIDSQSQERTRIDWRHYDVPARFRKGVLPSHVLDACLALTKGFGLNFGAIDLILTPDGRYVFLEINSNGQWAFVETLVPELKMTDSMVNALLNRP